MYFEKWLAIFFTNANEKMVHCVTNLGRFVGIIFPTSRDSGNSDG